MDRWSLTVIAGLALVTIGLAVAGQRMTAISRVFAWTASGPACPQISERDFHAYDKPASSIFRFEGVRFARAYGNASCANIAKNLTTGLGETPVCQFNSPGVLEVRTPTHRYFYSTWIEPVTITFSAGQPRCVMNAKLGADWMRN